MAELYPNLEILATNVSGLVSYLQNNNTVDWYTTADPGSTNELHVGMQDPGGGLAGSQPVSLYLRRTNNGTDAPTVDINLYDGGVLVSTLASVSVTSATGEIVSTSFDPATVSSGANVEIDLVSGTTGGMPGTRNAAEYGYVTWDAQLETEGATVTTGSATDITDTTATLNGTLDTLTVATSADVWFEWRAVGETVWNTTPVQTMTATGPFNAPISGLTASTNYEFRAQSTTTNTSSTGAIVAFTTKAPPTLIAGTVTQGGTAVGSVPVHIINSTTDAHVTTVTTAADGTFSYETYEDGPFHVAVQHDDGTTKYNAPSHHSIQ